MTGLVLVMRWQNRFNTALTKVYDVFFLAGMWPLVQSSLLSAVRLCHAKQARCATMVHVGTSKN